MALDLPGVPKGKKGAVWGERVAGPLPSGAAGEGLVAGGAWVAAGGLVGEGVRWVAGGA